MPLRAEPLKAEAEKLSDAGMSSEAVAQENAWQKKVGLRDSDECRYKVRTTSTCEAKKTQEWTARCCPLEEQHGSEGRTVSHRWDRAISGAWRRPQ